MSEVVNATDSGMRFQGMSRCFDGPELVLMILKWTLDSEGDPTKATVAFGITSLAIYRVATGVLWKKLSGFKRLLKVMPLSAFHSDGYELVRI